MTGLIVALCVLVLLTAVLLLRVGVQVEYGRPALAVRIRIGPGYVRILPAKRKKDTLKRPKKGTKPKENASKPAKKGQTLELLRAFLPLVLRTVRRLCGKLRVDELDMVLTAGAEDPGDAALQYGRANAVLGSLWQPIVTTCHVVDGHARVDIDFNAKHPEIYLLAGLSMRIGQLLALASVFAVQALIILLRRTKNTNPN
ncbi:MAG: hypothetical protein IJA11_00775 [Oscillospiraceae bacterium]|nr:hypothetical protein [Oscillospiraceae bacterium]